MIPDISVIIPVYNVAPWLQDCLDSVRVQTFPCLEIIIVDDGSTDASPQIIANYAAIDARVKIITQKNSGLGAARNAGINLARGEYLAFLDSDDKLAPDAYAKLYRQASKFNCDIVFCQASYLDDATGIISEENNQTSLPLFNKFKEESRSFNIREFTADEIFSYDSFVVAWNKLTKRSLVNRLDARFPEGLIFEDMPFYFYTLLNSENISVVWERLIYYRVNRINSITNNNAKEKDIVKILKIISDQLSLKLNNNIDCREAASAFAYQELCYKYKSIENMNIDSSDINAILVGSDKRRFKKKHRVTLLSKIKKLIWRRVSGN